MKKENTEEEIKTNLKHDNLEFTELSDGEEPIESAEDMLKDDEIHADELDAINDEDDNEAAALIATETDLLADEDQLPEEDWTDDLPDTNADEGLNHHRNKK